MSYCLPPKNSEKKNGFSKVQELLLAVGILSFLFCGQTLQAGSFSSRCELLWSSFSQQQKLQTLIEYFEEIPAAAAKQPARLRRILKL
jgi:hypothetical protein